jgi:hypothetical protein
MIVSPVAGSGAQNPVYRLASTFAANLHRLTRSDPKWRTQVPLFAAAVGPLDTLLSQRRTCPTRSAMKNPPERFFDLDGL